MNSAEAWLKSHQPRIRHALNRTVSLSLASGTLLILQAWLLAKAINGAVIEHHGLAYALPWLLSMLPIFLLRFGLVWASERAAFELGAQIQQELRNELYQRLQMLGPLWLHKQSSGDLANRITAGIEAIGGYYAHWLPNRALSALIPIVILIAVFPSDWVSGLVLILTAPLIPVFMILIGRGTEELNQRQWRQLARMSARFLDTLRGLTTLKLFDAGKREAEVVALISERYREATMKVLRVAFLSSVVLEFLSTVSIAVVAVFIGFRLLWGEMTFLPGFFVLLLAPEYYLPLRSLGSHYHARMEAIGAAEGLLEIAEARLPASPSSIAEASAMSADGPFSIVFHDIRFDYALDRQALSGISFRAEAGQITVLTGASGAGKSSIINLLLGFGTPAQGRIELDGRTGVAFDHPEWLANLAWVPQRPHMFDGTILDNIRLGCPNAGMAEVAAAAKSARAHGFISALPLGYQTRVGERGLGLSGGQVQRLALARAFLKDAPLVLLDEPTAHLDHVTEADILAAIADLARGRTVLMTTHRRRALELADQVVMLAHGRIVDTGSRAELLARHGDIMDMAHAEGAT